MVNHPTLTIITCRVCEAPAPAHDDGVLLCSECRADPAAAAGLVETAFQEADALLDRAILTCEPAVLERYTAVMRAWLAATRDGSPAAFARYHRRRQQTIATGDDLAKLLLVEDASNRARAWREIAGRELDALADAYEVAV